MPAYTVEIIDKFEESIPCSEIVYSSVPDDCIVRDNRVYEIQGTGTKEEFEQFVRNVLVDDVSQKWVLLEDTSQSAESNYDHRLDVWLKSDVLDLEEDYLLEYCDENREKLSFEVEHLRILTRYYLTLPGAGEDVVDTIVTDLANPVIHDWTVSNHA